MVLALLPYAMGFHSYLPSFVNSGIEWKAQLFLPYAALFLPAAIRRLSWRQGLVMLGFAGVAFAIDTAELPHGIGFPWNEIYWQAPFAGIAYWVASEGRTKGKLGLIFMPCAAIALVLPSLTLFACRMVDIPIWHGGGTEIGLNYICQWLLLAAMTWKAIQLAENRSTTAPVIRRWMMPAFKLLISAGWFLLFFHLLVYQLARTSIVHGIPIPRDLALWYFQTRQNAGDNAAVWHALESADWSHSYDAKFLEQDYRQGCIEMLSERDRARTALRLSALLRNHPSAILANDAAAVLAREHRFEAAPELMRYALADAIDCQHAKDALVSWGVPQAALAVLRGEAEWHYTLTGTPGTKTTPLWFPSSRADLSRLLGEDAGNRWADWTDLYATSIDERRSPLPDDTQKELHRVVTAVTKYWITAGRLRRSGQSSAVSPPNLDVAGTDAFAAEIKKYCDAADAIDPPAKLGANGK
jgi:hypothetical protein